MSAPHSWSGWPGAWCLHCGAEDPYEIALADDRIDFDDEGNPIITDALREELAPLMICPEPGSNRHNPYIERTIPDAADAAIAAMKGGAK